SQETCALDMRQCSSRGENECRHDGEEKGLEELGKLSRTDAVSTAKVSHHHPARHDQRNLSQRKKRRQVLIGRAREQPAGNLGPSHLGESEYRDENGAHTHRKEEQLPEKTPRIEGRQRRRESQQGLVQIQSQKRREESNQASQL